MYNVNKKKQSPLYNEEGQRIQAKPIIRLESDDRVIFVDGIEYHIVNGDIIEVDNHIGLL